MPSKKIAIQADTLKNEIACLHCATLECSVRETPEGCPDDECQKQGELPTH